jgi:hypothetical protein
MEHTVKSFLMIGQSNMAGRGYLHEVKPIVNERIVMLRNGRWPSPSTATVQSLVSALRHHLRKRGVMNTKKARLVSYHAPRAEVKSMSGMSVTRSITTRSAKPGSP